MGASYYKVCLKGPPACVASVAAKAMVSGSFSYSDPADETLTQLAQRHPEAAMAEIGKLMLDEQQAWTFFAGKFHIFTKLPEEIVTAWLRVHGVEAARTIARHVPAPTLDGTGNLLLPPLTEFVPVPVSPDETKESRCNSLHKWVLSAIAIRKCPGGTRSGPRGYTAPAHLR